LTADLDAMPFAFLLVICGVLTVALVSGIAARVSARRSLADLRGDPRFVASRTGGRGEPIARFDDGVAYIEVRPGELSIGTDAARSWELRADLLVRAPWARIQRKRLVVYRPAFGVPALPPLLPARRSRVGTAIDAVFRRGALAVQLYDGLLVVDVERTSPIDPGAVDAVAELARALVDAGPAPPRKHLVAGGDVGSFTGAPVAVPR
jgi:hypothetical protein